MRRSVGVAGYGNAIEEVVVAQGKVCKERLRQDADKSGCMSRKKRSL